MFLLWTAIFIWSFEAQIAASDDLCPTFMQEPFNDTQLVGAEHHCPIRVGTDICYSCCSSQNSVCCDDGSCMEYDPFCRYPETCCQDDYCGHQCCPHTYGVACGPLCAPKQDYQCCNASNGFMCAKPDFCCNGEVCCTKDSHCCDSNICCRQGEACCDDKCCRSGYHCCGLGSGQCCPDGSDCFPDGSCCPHGQACGNVTNGCCKLGSHCADDGNKCCQNYQTGCGDTCCDPGHVCCAHGKCCLTQAGCNDDGCCPVERACGGDNCCPVDSSCCPNSPTHHCCPNGQKCCHDHCCSAETGYCGANGECCPPGGKECGDTCCTASETCVKADAHHAQDFCCDGFYCPQTGQCCVEGLLCNKYGYCCGEHDTFCDGGAQTACFSPPYSVCCEQDGKQDGTACTPQYSQCIDIPSASGTDKACCPSDTNMMCNRMCLPEYQSSCKCCGDKGMCCYAPYTCQDDHTCMHIWNDGGPWYCWGCHSFGLIPHCCNYHRDVQPPLGGAPAQPRAGVSRPFRADYSQIFIEAIKPLFKVKNIHKEHRMVESHQKTINLPPPPTQKVNPSSYPCFNETTLNSTCKAWICLEEVAKCGTYGYIDRMHNLYCNDFGNLGNLFKPSGQEFLVCAANCATKAHVDLFRHGFKPCCTSMENWGNERARNDCIIACNFCIVYLSNVEGFSVLFDLISPGEFPSTIYAKLCGFG